MADLAITGLTELAQAPANDDVIEIIDISEATAANKNKQITIANLFSNVLTAETFSALVVVYEDEIVFYEGEMVVYA